MDIGKNLTRMGGKSSKANDKFIDKSLKQQPPKSRNYPEHSQPYDRYASDHRNTSRSRTPPTPAWRNDSQHAYNRRGDPNVREPSKALETSWGKTSFNTFDLHAYNKHPPSSQSYNDLSNNAKANKFSDFRNITDKREEKQKREQELHHEDRARNKKNAMVSNTKKPFSKHERPLKERRRNSLPDNQNQNVNAHNRNNKLYSKSSPQKKKLSVKQPVDRRISDVSTLSLSENTVPSNSTFKSLRQNGSSIYGESKSSKAAAAVYSRNTINNNHSPRKKFNEKPSDRHIATPPKIHPETLKPTNIPNNRRQPAAFTRLNSLTIGSR